MAIDRRTIDFLQYICEAGISLDKAIGLLRTALPDTPVASESRRAPVGLPTEPEEEMVPEPSPDSSDLYGEQMYCRMLARAFDTDAYCTWQDRAAVIERSRASVREKSYKQGYEAGYAKCASEKDAVTTGMLEVARREGYAEHAKHIAEQLQKLRDQRDAIQAKYDALQEGVGAVYETLTGHGVGRAGRAEKQLEELGFGTTELPEPEQES